jgi:two-component system nitrogen regulation response regulator NtrX
LKRQTILVVDDQPEILKTVSGLLEDEGYCTITASNGTEGLAKLQESEVALVLLDIFMPGIDGLETLGRAREAAPEVPVVMISGQATVDAAVRAIKLGAVDFVEKPLQPERLLLSVKNALAMEDLRDQNVRLAGELKRQRQMLGESEPMTKLREEIRRAAPSRARILIIGENGTGKELVAAAVHELSPRKDRPFVKVNCAAIPKDLIESELFGHEKGAFTGAVSRKEGKFDLADGGSILLDEIGDMSLETQAKLLRVLEEGEFERLGGKSSIKVDVRVISSTNKNLIEEIKHGRFREDLYFRIAAVPIRVPPLRERKEDIPLLARYFARVFSEENNRPLKRFSDRAVASLVAYDWPGNIRELKNVVERLVIMTDEEMVTEGCLASVGQEAAGPSQARTLNERVDEYERALILGELKKNGWNVSHAAAKLGMDRANLHRKMRRYGIQRGSGSDRGPDGDFGGGSESGPGNGAESGPQSGSESGADSGS